MLRTMHWESLRNVNNSIKTEERHSRKTQEKTVEAA